MSAASLLILLDTENPRVPYYRVRDQFPTESCVYVLGEYMVGVKISIRATRYGAAARFWRQFSGNGSGLTEKTILGLALWEHLYWVQVSAVENVPRDLAREFCPADILIRVLISIWKRYNLERNYRADRLRIRISRRLREWCTEEAGRLVPCNPEGSLFVPRTMSRAHVISSIVVIPRCSPLPGSVIPRGAIPRKRPMLRVLSWISPILRPVSLPKPSSQHRLH
ncbi:hypothetical protein PHMEG_00013754 [Phytophthora megakarya]|uniref:Uncharacterized protein n=1 Tax=Phytophthora megakarya TaxID=4795 RepID=A0A225W5Z2_9STRA|nr:hypothetical protein PHMEG_00013754 [Phytophthora megakarya]